VNPALSVIFFTTLSGAGYGMLFWIGVLIVSEYLAGDASAPWLARFFAVSLCVASVLIATGLVSSMLHLGKPGRAWRAFSQWRTSWLSREGVMSVITYVPVGILLVVIVAATSQPYSLVALDRPLLPLAAAGMTVCALVTVICTAMIYASLKTIPAWRHGLVVPGYLTFALLSGCSLLAAVAVFGKPHEQTVRIFAAGIAAMAVVTAALKLAYWRAIDGQVPPATRGDAVGLPGREISVFERPHTDESYITREMAFAVARKHARRLRAIALVLFGAMPILAALAAWMMPAVSVPAFVMATLTAFAGAVVERWLFFAEARHVVTLYY
jgi:DMSO reductase anchor subunit